MPFPRKLLNDGEDVVLDLHPHWWFFVKPTALLVVAIVAAFALRDSNDALRVIATVLALAALIWLATRYAVWANTNFTVTTDRLIYREGVLGKRGKEIPLERLNDIAVNQSLFERMIGAGDVTIESAGERGQQVFADIRKPFLVQNLIYSEIERAQARDAARAAGSRQLSIPEQIEKLDELRQRGVISQAEFDVKKTQLLDRM
ncbi:MAG TPA: PH domain-containing protein [Acidimicrobiales bacterium]|nr:PH domain-containing protein [Acidimicrobiales bacterium]